MKDMGSKIVFLGGCIPKGICSFYTIIDGKIEKTTGVMPNYNNSLIKTLTDRGCEIKNFCQSYSAMSYVGCSKPTYVDKPNTKISIVYKTLNNDLSEYDLIIVNCPVNDYRRTNKEILGTFDILDENTVFGSYGIIFNEFKTKYQDKRIVFILPPYGQPVKNQITFLEFHDTLVNKIKEMGYEYISFFEYISKMMNYQNMMVLFPDGAHPSVDCEEMYIKYCSEEIVKKI